MLGDADCEDVRPWKLQHLNHVVAEFSWISFLEFDYGLIQRLRRMIFHLEFAVNFGSAFDVGPRGSLSD